MSIKLALFSSRAPLFRLLGIEVFLLGIGWLLSLLTRAGKAGWYGTLPHSVLTPPDWVFGLVWTALYLMIGFVFWRLWERRAVLPYRFLIFALFACQMALNWAWPPLFFMAHLVAFSFFWLVALVSVLLALVTVLWFTDRVSAWLLLPYTFWCVFASYLSGTIWLAGCLNGF